MRSILAPKELSFLPKNRKNASLAGLQVRVVMGQAALHSENDGFKKKSPPEKTAFQESVKAEAPVCGKKGGRSKEGGESLEKRA